MSTHDLIDAQFDRAVQIVQSLPKTGPIQTDYEEKLQMYSLYKQATVGNVQTPRPGIFDMLGRAKWDAWDKHRDLDSFEAKWFYVDALLKVLRRYSDRTIARDLVQELESYGGDPSNLVLSRTFTRTPGSGTSASTVSEEEVEYRQRQQLSQYHQAEDPSTSQDEDSGSDDDGSDTDEARDLPPPRAIQHHEPRPNSAHSAHRYRTPMAGSLLLSRSLPNEVPQTQPLPGFETPSAFAPPSGYPQAGSHPTSYTETVREQRRSPQNAYPSPLSYRVGHQSHYPPRPASRPTLESAIENVQAHLAALSERIETLETRVASRSQPSNSPRGPASPRWFGRGSPTQGPQWDIEDLGLWSTVLMPMTRGLDRIREWAVFFARDENRSPAKLIVRRLCLDVSFFVFVVVIIGSIWRKSGMRRREVRAALGILWHALAGTKPQRVMTERGI
ncbi:ACBP-domain-containing protein [Coprinopsis marcescibilis]|uniref:ACBP-domain-containing protein n=1 Tax=Coprinopsis marcescibilis TaxID=230819 RepID=A0A5C3LB16_COPMA|nr:ACBP-domain-containing protein [Coprinopsis marcescibilis]